jgi:hypothetical protein
MAGFAVDIGDAGTAANRGVATPSYRIYDSASNQTAAIGTGLFSVLDDYGKAEASKLPSASAIQDAKVAAYATELNNLKGTDPRQMRDAVNALFSQSVGNGLKANQLIFDTTLALTGVDVKHINSNPVLDKQNKVASVLAENPAWSSIAEDQLKASGNDKPTQEEITQTAMSLIMQTEAASIISANAATMSQVQWDRSGNNTAILALDTIRTVGLKQLEIEIGGGNVSPESLERLKAEIVKVRASFPKPTYVSTESYSGVQTRLDALDALVESIEKYDTNVLANTKQGILNRVDAAIIQQIEANKNADPLLARAMLKNLDKLTEAFSTKFFNEITTILSGVTLEDVTYTSVDFSSMLEPELNAATENGPEAGALLHDQDEFDKATARTASERLAVIQHSLFLNVTSFKPEAMNQEDARKAFLEGIDKVSLNITTATQLVDGATMFHPRTGVFGENTFTLLKKVEQLDPAAAKGARAQLAQAIQAQSTIFSTGQSGVVADTVFELQGVGKIGLKVPLENLAGGLAKDFADKHYGGNVFNMLKDKGAALSTEEKTRLRGKGFPVAALSMQYAEITRINDFNKKFANALKKLGVDTTQFENLILNRQETELPAPEFEGPKTANQESLALIEEGETYIDPQGNSQVKPYTIKGDTDEAQQTFFNSLPVGAPFINPADGRVLYKKAAE